jgi:hypothetical protein
MKTMRLGVKKRCGNLRHDRLGHWNRPKTKEIPHQNHHTSLTLSPAKKNGVEETGKGSNIF